MKLKTLLIAGLASVAASVSNASLYLLYEDSFSISAIDGQHIDADSYYQVRWGTYEGGVFTPLLGSIPSDDDQGYFSVADSEFTVSVNLGNNDLIAAGSQFYLAITLLDFSDAYISSENELILTDASWIVPSFSLVGPAVSANFTSNTVAVKGGEFTFADGQAVIKLGAIPEPSTFAAIAGLAVIGAVVARRRRSA